MTEYFSVGKIHELLGRAPPVSRFTKEIHPDHRVFFDGRDILKFKDERLPYVPNIGSNIREFGLSDRWARYDQEYRSESRIYRFWFAEIRDAMVFPPHGIVASSKILLRDSIRAPEYLRALFPNVSPAELHAAIAADNGRIPASPPQPRRRIEGTSFLLGFGMFENYFNWTLRYASRVKMYQAQSEARKLIVPQMQKRYISETLEFMGVEQKYCCPLDVPLLCERLVLASPVALGRYELSPMIVETLRGHPRVQGLWSEPRRPIYIPRRNVSMRHVVNEPAVERALAGLGFHVFDNAAHSIQQQVKTFRNASLVVGPHGAGLSNIVYCNPGTPVIEIVPEGYDQGVTSYRSLADLFGLPYRQVFGKEVAIGRRGNRCNSDIEIDIDELMEVVREFI